MSTSPVEQARKALGQRLRQVRLDAALTARELGRHLDRHPSKISRIEHGAAVPSVADVLAWCTHCDADDLAGDLVATLQSLDEMWMEWKRTLRTGTARRQTEQVTLEAAASLVLWYEPNVIPGIVHTADYARGILSKVISFYDIPDDLEAGVSLRMERQQVLYSGNTRFHLLVAEQALYTTVGDAAVMAGQLDRLLAVQGLTRVSLGVIPRRAAFEVLTPGFIIFDTDRVMVETVSAELTITRPTELGLYMNAFQGLAAQAVYGAAARSLIRKALDDLDADP